MIYELWVLASKNELLVESFLPSRRDEPIWKLYHLLKSNGYAEDPETMIDVQGEVDLRKFKEVKGKLEGILLRCLVSQNISENRSHDRLKEYFDIQRNLLAARILLNKKRQQTAIKLFEKNLNIAVKYHMTEFVVPICRQLSWYFGVISFNKYKYNLYTNILRKYIDVQKYEIQAEEYSKELQRRHARSASNPTKEDVKLAEEYSNSLRLITNINTHSFLYNKYLVDAIKCEYNRDFEGLFNLSESAMTQFQRPELKAEFVLDAINIRRLYALIRLGNFRSADIFGSEVLADIKPESNYWFRVAYYVVKVRLYLANYRHAIMLMKMIFNIKYFKKLPIEYRELFETMLGYINLLIDSNYISIDDEFVQDMPTFRLAKFMNSTPIFSKDKRGINVSILLMHIAFLLQRKDYNAIIDRTDSLNQYAYRYLRKDDSFRSNCMIKMVIQMTKADFNPIRTARYTADLRKQLGHVTLAGSGENIEVEIIPFEVLWEIMMKAL